MLQSGHHNVAAQMFIFYLLIFIFLHVAVQLRSGVVVSKVVNTFICCYSPFAQKLLQIPAHLPFLDPPKLLFK